MASPQYSTPYSQLSYPSYTPLSVLPVKSDGSPEWENNISDNKSNYYPSLQHRPPRGSDADIRLLRAAVKNDVAYHKRRTASATSVTTAGSEVPSVHAEVRTTSVVGSGWPTPDTAFAQRRSASVSLFSTPSTRTNAPLYAPPLQQQQQLQHQPPSSIRYSDIDRVRSLPTVALTHNRPFPSSFPGSATNTTAPGAAVVMNGVEVDAQSDVVCAAEAVPYLCAFQAECQSLLALLNTPPAPTRAAVEVADAMTTMPDGHPSSPYQQVQQQRQVSESSTTVSQTAMPEVLGVVAALRPAPTPPTSAGLTPVPTPTPALLPPPASAAAASALLFPPQSSLHASHSPVAVAAPEEKAGISAVHPASTTYAQLLMEMDELASLLERKDSPKDKEDQSGELHHHQQNPAHPVSASALQSPTASTTVSINTNNETPEKQSRFSSPSHSANCNGAKAQQQRPLSRSRLAPSSASLVAHSPCSFWASRLLKWVIFLIEKKQRVLQRIQSFENTRAPQRRGAGAKTSTAAAGAAVATTVVGNETVASPSEESTALRVADGLLQLLRSLNSTADDVNGGASSTTEWWQRQPRHVCTRVSNLLAELTYAEEVVVAGLLNDAAAGATMEREGLARMSEAQDTRQPSVVVGTSTPPLPPAGVSLPPEYRRDMLETIALLEKITQENKTLKLQVADTHDQLKKLRLEVRGERDAKTQVVAHFDNVAAQNTDLAARLADAERKLHEAETNVQPNPEEGALRDQLDRQKANLRVVRRELDEAKEEASTLRRTVLQLRDALVRHRAVIDLLTRHRRGGWRQQQGVSCSTTRPSGSRPVSTRVDSPPMQLIEDILSGVCDAPSTTSTSLSDSVKEEELEGQREEGGVGTCDESDNASSEMHYV